MKKANNLVQNNHHKNYHRRQVLKMTQMKTCPKKTQKYRELANPKELALKIMKFNQ